MSAQPPAPGPIPYATPGAYPPPPPRRLGSSLFGWVLFIGLAVMLFLLLQTKDKRWTDIALSGFFDELEAGNVADLVIEADTLRAQFRKPVTIGSASTTYARAELPPNLAQNWSFIQGFLQHPSNPVVRVENHNNLAASILLPLIPWLLIFLFIWFFVFRQLRNRPAAPAGTPVYIVNPPPETK